MLERIRKCTFKDYIILCQEETSSSEDSSQIPAPRAGSLQFPLELLEMGPDGNHGSSRGNLPFPAWSWWWSGGLGSKSGVEKQPL